MFNIPWIRGIRSVNVRWLTSLDFCLIPAWANSSNFIFMETSNRRAEPLAFSVVWSTPSPSVKGVLNHVTVVHPKARFSHNCVMLRLVGEGFDTRNVGSGIFSLQGLPLSTALIPMDTLHTANSTLMHLSFSHRYDMVSWEFLLVHLTIASLSRQVRIALNSGVCASHNFVWNIKYGVRWFNKKVAQDFKSNQFK